MPVMVGLSLRETSASGTLSRGAYRTKTFSESKPQRPTRPKMTGRRESRTTANCTGRKTQTEPKCSSRLCATRAESSSQGWRAARPESIHDGWWMK